MEDESVEIFRKAILTGDFDALFKEQSGSKSVSLLDQVTEGSTKTNKNTILYYIYEAQYIELMAQGKNIEAITILQQHLVPMSPFGTDKTHLFRLASMVM